MCYLRRPPSNQDAAVIMCLLSFTHLQNHFTLALVLLPILCVGASGSVKHVSHDKMASMKTLLSTEHFMHSGPNTHTSDCVYLDSSWIRLTGDHSPPFILSQPGRAHVQL
ncbi:hypothetical protein AcV7_002554 [Taiwanofungus camphoratus]|nr:hypothetical protein AcV7_002554 [Antrodia cinnamomea]